jgi:hypothetical protein
MARTVGKGVLYIAGAGAVVALLANLDDIKNSKEVKDHWWLIPLGILVIGYMLRKRGHPYASAALAVGGALFALGYAAHSKQAQAQQQQQLPPAQQVPPLPPAPQPKPPQQMKKAAGETGFPFEGNPFAALGAPQGTMWVQTPDGQFVRLARPQLPMPQPQNVPFYPMNRVAPPFVRRG